MNENKMENEENKKPSKNAKKNKKKHEKRKKKKELEAALNEIVYCDLIKKKEMNINLIYLKSFPSGNIVATFDKYIIIYDIDFKEIQKIENAHEDLIHYVDIKDENNFVTCSDDLNIKTWIKTNGKYQLNKIIKKAHSNFMNNVKYYKDKQLISCGYDGSVKIWGEKEDGYEIMTIWKTKYFGIKVEEWDDEYMSDANKIKRFYLIKDKNRLIFFKGDAIYILNLKTFKYIKAYYGIGYLTISYMKRISKNLFAIGYAWGWDNTGRIVVLSLFEDRIIKDMKTPFRCYGMLALQDKKLLIIGGENDIMIVKTTNFECIRTIKLAHLKAISYIKLLKNGLIASFSRDHILKIWSLEGLIYKKDEKNNNHNNSIFLIEDPIINEIIPFKFN